MVEGRTYSSLLQFSALHHDVGKPATRTEDEAGMIHYYSHELSGGKIAYERARALRLSRQECERIQCVVKNHMRPLFFIQAGEVPSRRSIYRFFNATGESGIEICLLSMADMLATYGAELPYERWILLLDIVKSLFESWWDLPGEVVFPPSLVNGQDLMDEFRIKPGPLIGELLNLIRERQASGEIRTQREALDFARDYLSSRQAAVEI